MTWLDNNELIAYPLVDETSGLDSDILADVMLYAPASLGASATVSSLSVTSLVVSAVISINEIPVVYTTLKNSGALVGVPQRLTPLVPGVQGTLTWGSGITRKKLRFDGSLVLLPELLISYPAANLEAPTITVGSRGIPGRVNLIAGDGISITTKVMRVLREDSVVVTTTVAEIALDTSDLVAPLNPAYVSAEAEAMGTPPVRGINDVVPDIYGNIDVVALTIQGAPSAATVAIVNPGHPGILELTDTGVPCQ
jgi:hypothetical protein